ncbi:MAG TPA: hypothetical protein VGI70_12935 [Polyangiales bacterium]
MGALGCGASSRAAAFGARGLVRAALFGACGLVRAALFGACAMILAACGGGDVDASPSDALARFLEAMDRSAVNEAALKDAYALLDDSAQKELRVRADRAGFLTGRKFEPWEMIAQGRFRMRFAPAERGGMHTTVKGDSAVVQVKSEDGRAQVSVPMLHQAGRWRVRLDLPEIARAQNSGRDSNLH